MSMNPSTPEPQAQQDAAAPVDGSAREASSRDLPDCVTAQTTVASAEAAEALASALIEQGLAACVQVAQVRSYYRWQSQVHNVPEWLLTVKTTAEAAAGPLRDHIAQRHPYDEPEFIVQPIVDGSEDYLTWIRESVQPQV